MSLTDEQLALRRKLLTASDTYVLAGEGYADQSAIQVYHEKVRGTPRPRGEDDTHKRIGHLLEPLAMDLLREERGLVLSEATTERNWLYSWLGATPDRNVLDKPDGKRVAVAEAKVVMTPHGAREWRRGPPARVFIQTTIQMLVTSVRKAYVPALILGNYYCWEIERDDRDLGPVLLELDSNFWHHNVLPRVPPKPEPTRAAAHHLRELYPHVKHDIISAPMGLDEVAHRCMASKRAFKELQKKILADENLLKAAIGEHEGIRGAGWKATWTDRQGTVAWKKAAESLLKGQPPIAFEPFRGEPTREFELIDSR